jgi:hypothetical protein
MICYIYYVLINIKVKLYNLNELRDYEVSHFNMEIVLMQIFSPVCLLKGAIFATTTAYVCILKTSAHSEEFCLLGCDAL